MRARHPAPTFNWLSLIRTVCTCSSSLAGKSRWAGKMPRPAHGSTSIQPIGVRGIPTKVIGIRCRIHIEAMLERVHRFTETKPLYLFVLAAFVRRQTIPLGCKMLSQPFGWWGPRGAPPYPHCHRPSRSLSGAALPGAGFRIRRKRGTRWPRRAQDRSDLAGHSALSHAAGVRACWLKWMQRLDERAV